MLVVSLLLLAFPGTASAAEMWVGPARGSDRATGSRAQPLRSVSEAWSRIPARRTLTAPVTVQLRAGTYPSAAFPQYFESRWGSGERAMITLRSADGRGRAVLPANRINTGRVSVQEAGGGRLRAVVPGGMPRSATPSPRWTDRPAGEPALWASWPR